MANTNLFDELVKRGLVKDHTDAGALRVRLATPSASIYCGYDPTADSLHVGNLQMVVLLRRLQLAGHRVIALSGGGTGLIGDPSGRENERQLRSTEVVDAWTSAISKQLAACLPAEPGIPAPIFANNADWILKQSVSEFLRDVGKNFTVNYMLAKDSVSARISSENGLSFTEFTYMLLQAQDFLRLYDLHGCDMQVGGSDQWGNITAGISLLRKARSVDAYGLTSPLILRPDGKKFGKSESGAIWLSREKTSPFAMYQHFINASDAEVGSLLRRLTLLPLEEIGSVEREALMQPELRLGQTRLAEEVVKFVHGPDAVSEAMQASAWLFGGGERPDVHLKVLLAGLHCYRLNPAAGLAWDAVLADAGIARSKTDARQLIQGGGVTVRDVKLQNPKETPDWASLATDGFIVVSKGKKHKSIIQISDP